MRSRFSAHERQKRRPSVRLPSHFGVEHGPGFGFADAFLVRVFETGFIALRSYQMPKPLPTQIDHKLRVLIPSMPAECASAILDALEIPNLEKARAKKMDQWGWQRMPDTIALWEMDDDTLVMPRGFLDALADGAAAFDLQVELVESRNRFRHEEMLGDSIKLRAWQEKQVKALRTYEQGILKAPAGSGKTVAILAAIQETNSKALVIVNTKDILWQWRSRIEQFLPDYPESGMIGDGTFRVSDHITIATAQTLHSRYDKLEAEGFFDAFSFVCLDECHHATAETYNRIFNRFSARYRVGVSATPDKTGDFALATNVLGPVIHEVLPDEVDTLTKPTVVKVPTKFGYHFLGQRSRFQRSNYPQMIEALTKDPERNMQIVKCVLAHEGHHQLLISKRLEHLAILEDLLLDLGYGDPIVRVTGQDSNEDREFAVRVSSETPSLMLSTLADEALDIPRLDVLHLTFPQKNTGLITQQVGRVERIHPDKKYALIFDYVDGSIAVLNSQFRKRRFEVYEPRGYKIETRKVEV